MLTVQNKVLEVDRMSRSISAMHQAVESVENLPRLPTRLVVSRLSRTLTAQMPSHHDVAQATYQLHSFRKRADIQIEQS